MELLKPRRSFAQLIKAAKTCAASWDDGGWGIANNTSILSFVAGVVSAVLISLGCRFKPRLGQDRPPVYKQWPHFS